MKESVERKREREVSRRPFSVKALVQTDINKQCEEEGRATVRPSYHYPVLLLTELLKYPATRDALVLTYLIMHAHASSTCKGPLCTVL